LNKIAKSVHGTATITAHTSNMLKKKEHTGADAHVAVKLAKIKAKVMKAKVTGKALMNKAIRLADKVKKVKKAVHKQLQKKVITHTHAKKKVHAVKKEAQKALKQAKTLVKKVKTVKKATHKATKKVHKKLSSHKISHHKAAK